MNTLLSRPRVGLRGRLALHFAAAATALVLLGGCAHQVAPVPDGLLRDDLFKPPSEPVDAASVFALSDAMRAYADSNLVQAAAHSDIRRALISALYSQGQLQLSYDAGDTRNAAQAFEARAGNCLSLVIMTAALAKYLGLPVNYQSIVIDDLYTRSGGLTLFNGHVNLVLGRSFRRPTVEALAARVVADADDLTVDFLPQEELRGQRHHLLREQTIVAMYLNNRAAEALAAGRVDDSYWWAREALRQDPGFVTAANTLAVIYQRSGHLVLAEAALRHVLQAEDDNTAALSNLAGLLRSVGRATEARATDLRLAKLQPEAPFHAFDLGRTAMQRGDYSAALVLFQQELERQPYQPDVHFWTAQAYWRLNDNARAARHMALAMQHSTTRGTQQLYAAKLDLLRARHLQ